MTAKAASEWEDSATRVVADTRYFLNTFNAAAQLPSDILVIISSFLPTDEDIFAISQVCRRWRATFVSFPLLWTRLDCKDLPRTIARLERHRSTPLQLRLNDGFSMEALDAVLGHKGKITSVSTDIGLDQLQSLHSSFVTPFAEEIVLSVRIDDADDISDTATVDIKGEFPSLRRLGAFGFFVPTDKIVAPNLKHLSLEAIYESPSASATVSVLNMLQGCPQLETVLIHYLIDEYKIPESHVPVALPKLRSIGLGCGEVCCGLVLPLRFPPTAVVSFLDVSPVQVDPGVSFVLESIRYVLAAVDIQSLTLAHTEDGNEYPPLNGICIIRYEGPEGSLEIIDRQGDALDLVVGPGGLLLSHSPRLDGVKTLHLTDCSTDNYVMTTVASAVPNVTSVKFAGNNKFPTFLIPATGSQPLLPHLKHITGLPLDESLLEMVTARKEMGVPLDVLEVNDHHLTCCRDLKVAERLKEHVKEVKTWKRTAVPEYRINSVLLDVWKEAGHHVPKSLDWLLEWPDPY